MLRWHHVRNGVQLCHDCYHGNAHHEPEPCECARCSTLREIHKRQDAGPIGYDTSHLPPCPRGRS